MDRGPFGSDDLARLAERGIPVAEALRQLRRIAEPPPALRLDRPCTVGDGIEIVDEEAVPRLLERHEAAARAGRFVKFVPASGAATRMFQDLLGPVGGRVEAAARRVLQEIRSFPFAADLEAALGRRGDSLNRVVADADAAALVEALVGREGLAYADLPKGLLPFHRYEDGCRTAFEEHLVEAALTTRDAGGVCRVHVTVSPEHLEPFRAFVGRVRSAWERRLSVRFEISLSEQKPSTDTLAGDPDGGPFRDESGRLVFRPAGHGALLENLADLGADVVLIKNVDNVQPDRLRDATVRWKRILAGRLLELEERARDAVLRLEEGESGGAFLAEAAAFAEGRLHLRVPPPDAPPGETRAGLIEALDRPIRVAGVVRNTGEPGGGPFWVVGEGGHASPQIVEAAEVDRAAADQARALAAATHFNPVDLACSLRDARGRPHDARRFADPDAVIVARKSFAGRDLLALERPGLWNGAMARWATVFVEVPLATFSPVKTLFDLLRPEHQPE